MYDFHKLSDTQSILMYHSVVNVKKIAVLSFSRLSFKVAPAKLNMLLAYFSRLALSLGHVHLFVPKLLLRWSSDKANYEKYAIN